MNKLVNRESHGHGPIYRQDDAPLPGCKAPGGAGGTFYAEILACHGHGRAAGAGGLR